MEHLRILLTGASSFSGAAFARALSARGHAVVAPLPRPLNEYEGVKARRVELLGSVADVVDEAPVGSPRLMRLIQEAESWDLACIHHAVVGDYKSASFDVEGAVATAIANHLELAASLSSGGCRSAVLTRSVFEGGRGVSDDPSPIGGYAVAKSLTVDAWRTAFEAANIRASYVTITNPIGPLEEPRFVNYLVSTWAGGETPELRAPDRVRDNIPIEALAEAYADSCEDAASGLAFDRTPSLWISSNHDFAWRVSREFGRRWARDLPVAVSSNRDLSEPRIRVGRDAIEWFGSSEEQRFWDDYANYYEAAMDLGAQS